MRQRNWAEKCAAIDCASRIQMFDGFIYKFESQETISCDLFVFRLLALRNQESNEKKLLRPWIFYPASVEPLFHYVHSN